MKFKAGVSLNVSPKISMELWAIDEIYAKNGQEAVITSGTEGMHSKYSAHYRGDAIDLRTRYFSKTRTLKVARELRKELGKNYLVIVEKTHIHLQWRPSR